MATMQRKVIGGMFGLDQVEDGDHSWLPWPLADDERCTYLANARSALRLIVERLDPVRVWLPSYVCPVLVEALEGARAEIDFIEVDGRLNIAGHALSDVRSGDVVVAIDYFGRALDDSLALEIASRGATLVEDACQALYASGPADRADYVIHSPRKFLGVPDGGLLWSRDPQSLGRIDLRPPPPEWARDTQRACSERAEFDRGDRSDNDWYRLFQETEAASPHQAYAMSDVARDILMTWTEHRSAASRRRSNYGRLDSTLQAHALFVRFAPEEVPLGFPIRTSRRDAVRDALIAEEIFPPIHWDLEDTVPRRFSDSHRLSSEILTLPCDQRYGNVDMDRIASVVRGVLS